jgi:hypothetical protein
LPTSRKMRTVFGAAQLLTRSIQQLPPRGKSF